MNYKELEGLPKIKEQIISIKQEINEISYIGAAPINDMPHSHKKTEPEWNILQKKMKLESKLQEKINSYYDLISLIEDYIDTIQDKTIQTIARYRFINLKSWEYIAKNVNYSSRHCRRLMYNYLKKDTNIH